MKTVLITGINGFLGSHLAKRLKFEFKILGLANKTQNLHRINHLSISVYFSGNSLEKIFEQNKIFAVIHTATVYKQKNDSILPLLETNVELPVRLAELCSKYRVEAFINTDSFFNNVEYTYSYLSEYTLTKKQSLEWLKLISKSESLKLVNMKIFHMYGESDSESKFIPSLVSEIRKNSFQIKMTEGKQTRDFIYIKDVVNAYLKVLSSISTLKRFQEFDIGTGTSTSIKDFALLVKGMLNSKTNLLFGAIPYRSGEIMESKIENLDLYELGWKPSYPLERGLKEYIMK